MTDALHTMVCLYHNEKFHRHSWEASLYIAGDLFHRSYGDTAEEAVANLKAYTTDYATRTLRAITGHDWENFKIVDNPWDV